jgi:hypothetical protein
MYLFSKRMRVGHDFLTHFTQYSKSDNKLSSTVRYQVKMFFKTMSKVVSQETKCSILKWYETMKQDRPDLSYDDLVARLTDILNVLSRAIHFGRQCHFKIWLECHNFKKISCLIMPMSTKCQKHKKKWQLMSYNIW